MTETAGILQNSRALLDLFDDATLQAVVDGNTRLLPIDLPVDASTQAIAADILKERSPKAPIP